MKQQSFYKKGKLSNGKWDKFLRVRSPLIAACKEKLVEGFQKGLSHCCFQEVFNSNFILFSWRRSCTRKVGKNIKSVLQGWLVKAMKEQSYWLTFASLSWTTWDVRRKSCDTGLRKGWDIQFANPEISNQENSGRRQQGCNVADYCERLKTDS